MKIIRKWIWKWVFRDLLNKFFHTWPDYTIKIEKPTQISVCQPKHDDFEYAVGDFISLVGGSQHYASYSMRGWLRETAIQGILDKFFMYWSHCSIKIENAQTVSVCLPKRDDLEFPIEDFVDVVNTLDWFRSRSRLGESKCTVI